MLVMKKREKHTYTNLNLSLNQQAIELALECILPTSTSPTSLADKFASFFTDKISNLRLSLSTLPTNASLYFPPQFFRYLLLDTHMYV